jgi:hypothetical protein
VHSRRGLTHLGNAHRQYLVKAKGSAPPRAAIRRQEYSCRKLPVGFNLVRLSGRSQPTELPAMRILPPLVLLLSSGLLALTSTGANAPDRPPGIDADHWVPLGASTGIVLTSEEDETQADNANRHKPVEPAFHYTVMTDPTTLIGPTNPAVTAAIKHAEEREPIQGYLVVKQDGIWRRLHVNTR